MKRAVTEAHAQPAGQDELHSFLRSYAVNDFPPYETTWNSYDYSNQQNYLNFTLGKATCNGAIEYGKCASSINSPGVPESSYQKL